VSFDLDAYWAGYDATLARVRAERPTTLEALAAILNAFAPRSAGTCFFPSDGDASLGGALSDVGWDVWYFAEYLWDAKSPNGTDWIHYVEGDIYPGPDTLRRRR
jgi:hypothetical protein